MKKHPIKSSFKRNRIMRGILKIIIEKNNFLILGHKTPDEDCIASMVALGLLVGKFQNNVRIFLKKPVHEHFQYLINICEYNSIEVVEKVDNAEEIDALFVCDTPKPSMIELDPVIEAILEEKKIPIVEVDHHLGADSEFIGMPEISLVDEASSASELVGLIALKLKKKRRLLREYGIEDPLSRNIVLAILTGIVGDTKMGQFLKSKKEEKYYELFTGMYNSILAKETIKETNFSDKEQVFQEIERLSVFEKECYNFFINKKKFSRSVGYVVLSQNDMEALCRDCRVFDIWCYGCGHGETYAFCKKCNDDPTVNIWKGEAKSG